jgi:hypothetical protein
MRGSVCTEDQIRAAKDFLGFSTVDIKQVTRGASDDDILPIRYGDLARLVAWYGAIRFISGRDGIGTFESPAPLHSAHTDQIEKET